MSDDLATPNDRNRVHHLPDPRAGGRQRIIRMHLEPPRPIVVSPSRLTLGGLGTALGVPLGMALLVAHFGDLHHLHMAWFLGGMALLMLLASPSPRRSPSSTARCICAPGCWASWCATGR